MKKQSLSGESSWALVRELLHRYETLILYTALAATWTWVFIRALG